MDFVSKTINGNDNFIIDLSGDEVLNNKLFFFSDASISDVSFQLSFNLDQINTNIKFDLLFPSDSSVSNIVISNRHQNFYENNRFSEIKDNVRFTKQSFDITMDENSNSNINIFSTIFKFIEK